MIEYTAGTNPHEMFSIELFSKKINQLARTAGKCKFILPAGRYMVDSDTRCNRYFYESDWNVIISDGLNPVMVDFTAYTEDLS